jgi:hypothetical protein
LAWRALDDHAPFQSSSGFFYYASLSPTRVCVGLRAELVNSMPPLDRHTIGLVVNEGGLRFHAHRHACRDCLQAVSRNAITQQHQAAYTTPQPSLDYTHLNFFHPTTEQPEHNTQAFLKHVLRAT